MEEVIRFPRSGSWSHATVWLENLCLLADAAEMRPDCQIEET